MTIVPQDKLRNSQNRRVTRALFPEIIYDPRYAFFTLQRWDRPIKGTQKEHLTSFPQLYLKYCTQDPTEYLFAIEVFGDWEHWQMVADLPALKPTLTALRTERDIAIKSKGFLHVAEEISTGGRSAYAAAKWLAEKGWAEVETPVSRKQLKEEQAKREEEKESDRAALALAKSLSEELGLSVTTPIN